MSDDTNYLKRIIELEAELAELEAEKAAVESINDDLEIKNQALEGQLRIALFGDDD